LIYMYCDYNRLVYLPRLNEKLTTFNCSDNELIVLPRFNTNLRYMYCHGNHLTELPQFNEELRSIYCTSNPFYVLNPRNETLDVMRIKTNTLVLFRELYYAIKFKRKFRRWLWELVREPKISRRFHPNNLVKCIEENDDNLDIAIEKFIGDD
jgi:Leucine-rich repeat (LRR) protein